MGNKIPSQVYDTKGRVVDVAFSMRRNTKQPLDESSLPLNYDSLKEEMKSSTSSIYKGQIVVTQGPEIIPEGEKKSDYYTPFLIKNEGNSDVSYYADRIMTATYTNTFLQREFVKKKQLGTSYTGVGKWPDATEDRGSLAYNEIFNDYNTYKITNNLKGESPIMSHIEGKSNTLSGSFTHIEGYKNTGGSDFSHIEGANNNSSNNASYSHVEGESNSAINSSYSHIEGHSNQAISAASSHVGGSNSKALGNNAFVHGADSVAFENGIAIGKSIYAKAGFATGTNTSSYGIGAFATGSKTISNGNYSVAEGEGSISNGQGAHAEGKESKAYGKYSHTEGSSVTGSATNTDLGSYSHAENKSTVLGTYSHAENNAQITETANYAHAEGSGKAMGSFSHVEGTNTVTTGTGGHAEGIETNAYEYSHAEGNFSYAKGTYAHAEGSRTMSAGTSTHAEGTYTSAYNIASHAEGGYGRANSNYSHAEGYKTYITSNAIGGHAEGNGSYTTAEYAHAEGVGTYASGSGSHAEGNVTHANGQYSHAEGNNTIAESTSSHAEGERTKAIGQSSHTEGVSNYAGGLSAHAEGNGTYANGVSSHSQGVSTYANGEGSFASGNKTTAQSNFSSSFGVSTYANGIGSISEGNNTSSYGEFSHSGGVGSISRGSYSFTDGFYTVSKNKTEVGHGTYNRSYYSANGFLVENNDTNKIPNEFARVNNKYLPGRFPNGIDSNNNLTGTGFYESSYETIFSIGNGGTGDTSNGPSPLYKNSSTDAGQYVKKNSRHNIMDIRKNGQMYYDGGMIVGGEVVAPTSYSYVNSLGPTAYLTTIMRALLVQPKYYRPSLQYKIWYRGNGSHNRAINDNTINWAYFQNGTDVNNICEVGATTYYRLQFRAFNVGVDKPQNIDPIYGTSLGNMLGYSTGVTSITYQILTPGSNMSTQSFKSITHDKELLAGMKSTSTTTYYWPKRLVANNEDINDENYIYLNDTGAKDPYHTFNWAPPYKYKDSSYNFAYYSSYCNAVENRGAFGETGKTYYSTGLYSTPSYVINEENMIKADKEGTYTLWKATSYTFNPATQMYFQQLMEKATYIPDDGAAPYDKFGKMTSGSNAVFKIHVRYRIYYGITDSVPNDSWKNWTQNDFLGHGEYGHGHVFGTENAGAGTVQNVTQGWSSTAKTCWFAFPENIYSLNRYDHSMVPKDPIRYMYYKNAMNAESSLDTGRITDTVASARPMYEYVTNNGINPSGLKYHIIAVSAPAGITKGTWGFSFKRK